MHRSIGRRLALCVVVGAALLVGSCTPQEEPTPRYTAEDVGYVTEWMENLYGLVRVERISPPVAARTFAYSAVAFYEALQPSLPQLQTLAGQVAGLQALPQPAADVTYDWLTVALTAQERILRDAFAEKSPPSLVQIEDLAYAQRVRRVNAGVPKDVMTRSVAHGEALADALLAWAHGDGFHERADTPYDYKLAHAGPHHWVPTATAAQSTPLMASPATDFVNLDADPDATTGFVPDLASERMLLMNRPDSWLNPRQALEPNWRSLRPFTLPAANACQPPAPPAYSEDPGSEFYEQVEAVYEAYKNVTEEQVTIARFWADCPGSSGTPAGHWVMIMRQLIDQQALSMADAVELYGVVGLGMQDAFISCWDEKYRSNLVRPITYIHKTMDPAFQTLVVTPPFPEYTSGHSVVSGAAGALIEHFLGDVGFTDRTHAWLGFEPRTFERVEDAVWEAAYSRLYGGIHYPMAVELGVGQGECVARQVLASIQTRTDGARKPAPTASP